MLPALRQITATPALLVAGGFAGGGFASAANEAIKSVSDTPDLVAFWTFGEAAGSARQSVGTQDLHPLAEVGD